MKKLTGVLAVIAATLFVFFAASFSSAADRTDIRIGVLAYRGAEQAKRMWAPTADYLAAKIPDHTFSVVPLGFDRINQAVSRGEVDFILANSSIYVELEYLYGVNRIATIKKKADTGAGYTTVFGGVIFTRADRKDIRSIADLKGKSFIAVDETSLGGWRVAWREMKDYGVDPYRDLARLSFAVTHDAAVYAVRDGKAAAGTVRTDILESLHNSGLIDMKEFRVLNQTAHDAFPFLSSTRLYPEWPFARVKHTSNELSQRVAVALMTLGEMSEAARSSQVAGWTIPLDYGPVHDLLKELRLTPYENFGKITLAQALKQYWLALVLTAVLIFVMTGATIYVSRLNAGLRQAKAEIEKAQRDLEVKVEERTKDLRTINEELEQEIVQRRSAEEALKESERRFRETLASANLIAVQLDREGTIIFANDYLAQLSGWTREEIIGRNWFDLFIPGGVRNAMRRLHQESTSGELVQEYASEIVTRQGDFRLISWTNSRMLDASGHFVGITSLGMDITYRQQMEEQIVKTQKLEAVGTLAGGIAHDFNNLLQGIFGYISMAKLNLVKDSRTSELLQEAENALGMATGLTHQLLTYAKGGKPVKALFMVDTVIKDAVKLSLSGSRVGYAMHLDDDLWPVEADAGQLGQVIQNIIINAVDAMPQGGTITISARNVQHTIPSSEDTRFVRITIEDSGSGISEKDLKRIFDPYFTTKTKGSGLGLATAYSIIRNHGGMIEVESAPGKGSTFFIYLPAAAGRTVHGAVAAPGPGGGRRGKILVMDDEEILRRISFEMLTALGHDVALAKDGEEAIALYREAMERGESFDIVILDLTIRGGMGGEEAMQGLLRLDPAIKAVVSSGYADGTAIAEYERHGFSACLRKPYSVDTLKETLEKLLG